MKKLALFMLTTLMFSIHVNAQWVPCGSGLEGSGIGGFAADGFNIYTGNGAGIFMSTDNGDNWLVKNNGIIDWQMSPIESLALSGNYIFAGSNMSGIYRSTDKGENWERKSKGLPYLVSMDTLFKEVVGSLIINGSNIYAGTYGERDTINGFYLSTDYGNNWTIKNNGLLEFKANKEVYSLAVNGNNIFAGTRYGVYMTSDNGDNWIAKNIGMWKSKVFSLAVNGDNIFAGAVSEGIFLSTDNGDNWKHLSFKDTFVVYLYIKGNYIFASGVGVYVSTDNGNSWIPKYSGITDGVSSIIINGNYIFAGTLSKGVFRAKLSDLGITDVKEQEQKIEIKIEPNPASDEFRLRFHSPIETIVQINIFDLLGNCVFSQKLQSAEGTNEKTINCEILPQGYYYVKININEIVETIPLVIVK